MKKILLLLTSIMLLHDEDSVEKDEQDPYEKLTVRTIQVSLIRPGLGRDPDLH